MLHPAIVVPSGMKIPDKLLVVPPGCSARQDGIWGLSNRAKGLIRSEGKDYIVKDGDVCFFKFAN